MADERAPVNRSEPRAVIEVGARFRGLLLLREAARIDGRVEGHVEAAAELAIGASACVIGPVKARDALVAGRVEGDVRASDRILLEATAHVRGELSAPRLVLREGSFLEGSCQSGAALADASVARVGTAAALPAESDTSRESG